MNLHWFGLAVISRAPRMKVSSCLLLLIRTLIVIQMPTLMVSVDRWTNRTPIVLTVEVMLSWLLAIQWFGILICKQKLNYPQWRLSMWHSEWHARMT
ncbi:hypothetical protein ACHAW6_003014 [Cyclotella cf. meneghiniana]